jgi:O-antigen ligase
MAFIGIRDFLLGQNLVQDRLYGRTNRYGDPNDFSVTLACVIPLTLYLLRVGRSPAARMLAALCCLAFVITIVMTYSRTGSVALGMIGLGLVLKSRRRVLSMIAIGLSAVVLFSVAPPRFRDRISSIFVEEKDEVGSRGARIALFWKGVSLFREHPLRGIGLGNFLVAEGRTHEGEGAWNAAHNMYLEVAVELGILGLASLAGLLLLTRRNLKELQRTTRLPGQPASTVVLASMLEISFWVFAVVAFFGSNIFNWMLCYIMGLSTAAHMRHRERLAIELGSVALPVG